MLTVRDSLVGGDIICLPDIHHGCLCQERGQMRLRTRLYDIKTGVKLLGKTTPLPAHIHHIKLFIISNSMLSINLFMAIVEGKFKSTC